MKTIEQLARDNPVLMEELSRTNEKLAITITTDIPDWELKIISAVEKVAIESSEGRKLVRIRDLKGEKANAVWIPKEQTPIEPDDIPEGTTVTPVKIGIDPIEISLEISKGAKRVGKGISLSQDLIDDAYIDIVDISLQNLGKGFASWEDKQIFSALLREVDVPDEDFAGNVAVTVYQLAHLPSLQIIKILADAVDVTSHLEKHDMKNGKFKMDADYSGKTLHVHYTYTTHSLVQDAITKKALAYGDVSGAFYLSRNLYEVPRILVVSPRGFADIIADTKYISAFVGTGRISPIISNVVGEFAGLQVIVTTRMPENCSLELDPQRFLMMLLKGGMYEKPKDNPESDSHDMYFYERLNFGVVNASSASIIVNIGAKSASL